MTAKRWTYTAGKRPYRVTITERGGRGGMLQARVWNPNKRRVERVSLGHRDKERAKVYAAEMNAKLVAGNRELREGRVTLAKLFSLYSRHRTPTKSASEQRADERRFAMWLRTLGPITDAHGITSRAWEGFVRDRRSGAIDASGRLVPSADRTPVGNRTVAADCLWLRCVLNWGVKERVGADRYLLRENCVRGFDILRERNPNRPVATRDRYETIRAVTDDVRMELRWEHRRLDQRSYLSEVFDLAMATGRRISSVCQLRHDDLQLSRGPYGFVRWRADSDKEGRESVVPIDEEARAAIDRQLARRMIVGQAYVFPSPTNADKPMSRHLADAWLRRAEGMAGAEPQTGSLWHAYRRGWATARKNLPSADVAKLGGWSGTETLEKVYQQADVGTMLEIISTRHELREAR